MQTRNYIYIQFTHCKKIRYDFQLLLQIFKTSNESHFFDPVYTRHFPSVSYETGISFVPGRAIFWYMLAISYVLKNSELSLHNIENSSDDNARKFMSFSSPRQIVSEIFRRRIFRLRFCPAKYPFNQFIFGVEGQLRLL